SATETPDDPKKTSDPRLTRPSRSSHPIVTLFDPLSLRMADELSNITSPWLRRFRASLRRWHKRHGRNLPWRNCRDPYKVWISEIMLQQTTVAAVMPFFGRFLQHFPNVAALAD